MGVGWLLKRPACLMKQFSFLEIASTATVLLAMVVESSRVFHVVDWAALQATHMCTPAPYGMLAVPAVLPTHSFGDVDHLVIQIFALCVRCRLVLWRWPHCSTVCKVATAPLLQTKVALSPGALPKLHGLHHQHYHPIKGLLSLLLTHHFLVMDVDCHLTCTSVIPMIIWFIVLALGLFKSPFHICDCLTDGLPHALSTSTTRPTATDACAWAKALRYGSLEGKAP